MENSVKDVLVSTYDATGSYTHDFATIDHLSGIGELENINVEPKTFPVTL